METLVQVRRIAQAVLRLGSEHQYEAAILARSAMETWVNVRWIRLKDTRRRANRFVKYEHVEQWRLAEDLAEPIPPSIEREMKRGLRAVRHLFYRNRRWAKAWDEKLRPGGRGLAGRLDDLNEALATSEEEGPLFRVAYRLMSLQAHGTQRGLSPLVEVDRDLVVRPRRTPREIPQFAVIQVSYALFAMVSWAVELLAPAYEPERRAAYERHLRLLDLDSN